MPVRGETRCSRRARQCPSSRRLHSGTRRLHTARKLSRLRCTRTISQCWINLAGVSGMSSNAFMSVGQRARSQPGRGHRGHQERRVPHYGCSRHRQPRLQPRGEEPAHASCRGAPPKGTRSARGSWRSGGRSRSSVFVLRARSALLPGLHPYGWHSGRWDVRRLSRQRICTTRRVARPGARDAGRRRPRSRLRELVAVHVGDLHGTLPMVERAVRADGRRDRAVSRSGDASGRAADGTLFLLRHGSVTLVGKTLTDSAQSCFRLAQIGETLRTRGALRTPGLRRGRPQSRPAWSPGRRQPRRRTWPSSRSLSLCTPHGTCTSRRRERELKLLRLCARRKRAPPCWPSLRPHLRRLKKWLPGVKKAAQAVRATSSRQKESPAPAHLLRDGMVWDGSGATSVHRLHKMRCHLIGPAARGGQGRAHTHTYFTVPAACHTYRGRRFVFSLHRLQRVPERRPAPAMARRLSGEGAENRPPCGACGASSGVQGKGEAPPFGVPPREDDRAASASKMRACNGSSGKIAWRSADCGASPKFARSSRWKNSHSRVNASGSCEQLSWVAVCDAELHRAGRRAHARGAARGGGSAARRRRSGGAKARRRPRARCVARASRRSSPSCCRCRLVDEPAATPSAASSTSRWRHAAHERAEAARAESGGAGGADAPNAVQQLESADYAALG